MRKLLALLVVAAPLDAARAAAKIWTPRAELTPAAARALIRRFPEFSGINADDPEQRSALAPLWDDLNMWYAPMPEAKKLPLVEPGAEPRLNILAQSLAVAAFDDAANAVLDWARDAAREVKSEPDRAKRAALALEIARRLKHLFPYFDAARGGRKEFYELRGAARRALDGLPRQYRTQFEALAGRNTDAEEVATPPLRRFTGLLGILSREDLSPAQRIAAARRIEVQLKLSPHQQQLAEGAVTILAEYMDRLVSPADLVRVESRHTVLENGERRRAYARALRRVAAASAVERAHAGAAQALIRAYGLAGYERRYYDSMLAELRALARKTRFERVEAAIVAGIINGSARRGPEAALRGARAVQAVAGESRSRAVMAASALRLRDYRGPSEKAVGGVAAAIEAELARQDRQGLPPERWRKADMGMLALHYDHNNVAVMLANFVPWLAFFFHAVAALFAGAPLLMACSLLGAASIILFSGLGKANGRVGWALGHVLLLTAGAFAHVLPWLAAGPAPLALLAATAAHLWLAWRSLDNKVMRHPARGLLQGFLVWAAYAALLLI